MCGTSSSGRGWQVLCFPGEEPGAFVFVTRGSLGLELAGGSGAWELLGGSSITFLQNPSLGRRAKTLPPSVGSRTGGSGVVFSCRIHFFLPHGKAGGGIYEGCGLVTAGAGYPSLGCWVPAGMCWDSSGRGSPLARVGRDAHREPNSLGAPQITLLSPGFGVWECQNLLHCLSPWV